jgi:hypothetical protein
MMRKYLNVVVIKEEKKKELPTIKAGNQILSNSFISEGGIQLSIEQPTLIRESSILLRLSPHLNIEHRELIIEHSLISRKDKLEISKDS